MHFRTRIECEPAMDVQAIVAGVSPLESLPRQHMREMSAQAPPHHANVVPAAPTSDVAATLSTQIAAPDLARLDAILQPHSSSEVAAHITELTQDAALALAEGDRPRALANLNEIAAVDPRTIAALAPEQALQPIRSEVDQLLNRLTTVAKMDAEGWLAQADQALETPGHSAVTDWQTRPATLLEAAHRLYESGGYTNYVRSADLAQTLVNPAAVAYSPFLEQYAASQATKPADAAIRPENEEILSNEARLSKKASLAERFGNRYRASPRRHAARSSSLAPRTSPGAPARLAHHRPDRRSGGHSAARGLARDLAGVSHRLRF